MSRTEKIGIVIGSIIFSGVFFAILWTGMMLACFVE